MTFRDIAVISVVGYIPLYLAYLMWSNRADNLDFIIYIQQGNLSKFWIYAWYYYLLFALFIGGAPIPEGKHDLFSCKIHKFDGDFVNKIAQQIG